MRISIRLTLPIALALHSLALSYDYVVIGGGTAGLAVANRLSEEPSVTVAVLEAGPNAEHLPEVFIPGLIGTGQSIGGLLDWQYATTPQQSLNGRSVVVHAGKALGGSSVLNAMIFVRAQKEQYDAWGTLNNDSSWSFSGLLPYFKRSEHVHAPNKAQAAANAKLDLPYRGTSGPIQVGYSNYQYPQSMNWCATCAHYGIQKGKDLTNGDAHAYALASNSLDPTNNTRCSSVCAYYTPFTERPNFSVLTNVTVTRILWGSQDHDVNNSITATAVEYVDRSGKKYTVSIKREVIVSAGTLGSPKILELSGVGNETVLKAAGVSPVLNLPSVGENLSDHAHSWANAIAVNVSITKDVLAANPAFAAEQLALWYHNRTGPYSNAPRYLSLAAPLDIFDSSKLNSLLATARTNLTYYAELFANGNAPLARGIAAQHNIAFELYARDKQLPMEINLEPGYSGPTSPRPSGNFTTINAVFYAPLSRGRVHIASADPSVPPHVDPAYWSHPLDVRAHVAGVQLARKILRAPPLDAIFGGEFEPGPQRESDEDVEAWLRSVIQSDNHEVGSLVMLPRELGGVVDNRLKVYGTANVRVVDASVFPLPISAHTSSTVYAVAEKAADLIKADM